MRWGEVSASYQRHPRANGLACHGLYASSEPRGAAAAPLSRRARLRARLGRFIASALQRICTLPETCAVTVALPASTGSASSAEARMACARITGITTGPGDSAFTATSRTV